MRTSKKASLISLKQSRKIMEAALEVFAEEGYHSSSMNKISNKSGVSKSLMYYYFDSKEALLKEIMLDGLRNLTIEFDPDHDGILTDRELVHFIRESIKTVKAHPSYWRLYFVVMYQSPATKLFRHELMSTVNEYLSILEHYFNNKGVSNARAEAKFFISILDGVCVNYLHDQENYPLDAIEEKIIKMYS